MSRIIQWGVIGSGGIARRRTIPEGLAAASNAKLTAVVDVNAAANQKVAARLHFGQGHHRTGQPR